MTFFDVLADIRDLLIRYWVPALIVFGVILCRIKYPPNHDE